ncbi:MAG: hypothetical protein HYZ79_01415 [Candidatus Melainabacteria bacterium]|nr:hypothetical protein [Candidatus Melainabacteria bacterium]
MFPEKLKQNYPTAIKFLINAINKDKAAHSYIFIGNCMEEMRELSIEISKLFNCKEKSKACNKCLNCRWLNENNHPQAFITIKPDESSKKEQIKVEQIRELLTKLTNTSDFYRIIFFENANIKTLTPECCNILLKTVEESPSNTMFIFASSTKEDILPTISSRSQIIYLSKNINDLLTLSQTQIPDNLNIAHANDLFKTPVEIIDYFEENKLDLKTYFKEIAYKNYISMKEKDTRHYCNLYNKLSEAYLKSNAFINSKNILEDICLSSSSSTTE